LKEQNKLKSLHCEIELQNHSILALSSLFQLQDRFVVNAKLEVAVGAGEVDGGFH